jgi:hypothetical protein
MAFEKLTGRPPRSEFLDFDTLSRMSDEQYAEEVAYWQGIASHSGIWHMEFAGDSMLERILPALDNIRQFHTAHPGEAYHGGRSDQHDVSEVIGVMAISHLLRTDAYQARTTRGFIGASRYATAIDIDSLGYPVIAVVHDRVERVEAMLPGFDPHAKPAEWYADDALVLSAHAPAVPTAVFQETYEGVSGGKSFDPSKHVTLRPHLLKSYVQ